MKSHLVEYTDGGLFKRLQTYHNKTPTWREVNEVLHGLTGEAMDKREFSQFRHGYQFTTGNKHDPVNQRTFYLHYEYDEEDLT